MIRLAKMQEASTLCIEKTKLQEENMFTKLKNGAIRFSSQLDLQLMVIPAIVWLIIFCYIPMYGIVIAFKDYKIWMGFFSGPWVGLKHFEAFFADKFAINAIKNTLIISGLKLLFGFPAPIIFALLLNEIRSLKFKKFVQSVSYLPFFISWVVLASMLLTILGIDGPINMILLKIGIIDNPISFLAKPEYFRTIAVVSDMWKGIGWSSIIYIAAISSISQEMYESAYIDGATRLQRAIHITIPSIMSTIVILLIMAVSGILGSNFEQHLLLGNAMVLDTAETIDTYVYRMGIQLGRYSFATAISLSRSIVSFFLLLTADRLARLLTQGEHGLF